MHAKLTALLPALAISLLTACSGLSQSPMAGPVFSDPAAIDEAYPPAAVETVILSHGARLPGYLYLANGPGPHPTVILAHGYPGNEKNADLAQAIRRTGFNVLRFNYRGSWGAEGDYSLTHVHEDVLAALAHLRNPDFAEANRIDTAHLSLVGHSMGGYAVLRAASEDAGVQCVAGLSSANLDVIADRLEASPDFIDAFKAYTDQLVMLRGYSGDQILDELRTNRDVFDPASFRAGLRGKSVLLLTGDKDAVVPPDQMQAPMVALFSTEPGIDLSADVISGDHAYSWSRQQLARRVTDWLEARCR